MNYLHFPYDINKDGHCDICGKFVDSNGLHGFQFKDQVDSFFKTNSIEFNDNCMTLQSDMLLLSKEKLSLNYYCRNNPYDLRSSPNINSFIRNTLLYTLNERKIIEAAINNIESAINMYEITSPFTVYRGYSISSGSYSSKILIDVYNDYIKNGFSTYCDEAFLSTSTCFETAKKYLNIQGKNNDIGVLIELKACRGTKALPLKNFTNIIAYKTDNEILFSRNSKIYIEEMKKVHFNKSIMYFIKGLI